jgi:hypothetical protein
VDFRGCLSVNRTTLARFYSKVRAITLQRYTEPYPLRLGDRFAAVALQRPHLDEHAAGDLHQFAV